MQHVDIRPLTAADASAYWHVRIEALETEPDAFGSSAEERAGSRCVAHPEHRDLIAACGYRIRAAKGTVISPCPATLNADTQS